MNAHCQLSQTRAAGTFSGLLAALTVSFTVGAAEEPKSQLREFFEQDYLLGDWWGLRTDLHERGVDFEFLYGGSLPMNVHGGIKTGSAYQGGLLMTLDLHSDKLLGYTGGQFHVGGLWLHGEKPFSMRHIGDLNKVNLLDYDNDLRLWELWYEHKFFDGKLSIKAGQLDIAMDFITPEYYNSMGIFTFLNQTFMYPTMAYNVFDQPYFPVGNHGLAVTPLGALGARVRADFCPAFYAQAGVYDGNPDQDESGTDFSLGGGEGALAYFEMGFRNNASADSTGVPGNVKLGGWYHTDDFVDMYQGTFVAFDNFVAANGIPLPPISGGSADFRGGNWGVYGLVDHVLWLEQGRHDPAMQGLVGFVRAAFAPPDRNLAEWGVDGGLVYKGLIPTRDWDTLGVAYSYMRISDDLRRAQQAINAAYQPFVGFDVLPKADYEAVLEINYRAQLAAWWTLQTSVQRVFHPGGRVAEKIPDAWAVIVQTTLRF